MPLYEYECADCSETVEVLVRGSEQPECPKCGSTGLSKLLSVPAAPAISGRGGSLPVCGPSEPSGGTCGLPQCGSGGCMWGD